MSNFNENINKVTLTIMTIFKTTLEINLRVIIYGMRKAKMVPSSSNCLMTYSIRLNNKIKLKCFPNESVCYNVEKLLNVQHI